jgi:hypothetical protein
MVWRWPAEDIHLDLDAIRSATDPSWRKKSARIRRAYRREYGRAIAAMRREHGLKQSEVDGISERQLRRIEQTGDVSMSTLDKLAKAHRMPLDRYLDEVARKS